MMSSALAAVPAAVEVIPLNGHIGAEIRGVHLSRLSPEHFAAVLAGQVVQEVIGLRGPDLSGDDLRAGGRRVGRGGVVA
ncbi:MAG: hypothetical protein ACK5PI_08610, partial [Acetobacteraceae bacterium]